MNRLIIASLLALSVSGPSLTAQTPADSLPKLREITDPGSITLILPAGMTRCLAPRTSSVVIEDEHHDKPESVAHSQGNTRVGYRVQVFDDNNVMSAKHEAQSRKQQIESRFPEFRTYVQFNSPYWKVKAGDFRTRSEADAAMAAIRAAFPSYASQIRVVRDRINP